MKKRAYLLPLATSVAALVGSADSGMAAPAVPALDTANINAVEQAQPATPQPLVIERVNNGSPMPQYAHSSHASHASHASHTSHHSSHY